MRIILIFQIFWILGIPYVTTKCLDDNSNPVEWFIAYKFPDSFDYSYILPTSETWKNSSFKINTDGMIKNTFNALYAVKDKPNTMYAMYNDEKSHIQSGDVWFGHMKGAFTFDLQSGFWLIHSVPKLSESTGSYAYPETGKVFAQHFFCVTLSATALDSLIDQLLIARPWIQDYYISKETELTHPKLLSLINHKSHTNITHSICEFMSFEDGLQMLHFSKGTRFQHDLYANLVAPRLKTGLNVETWQHGSDKENEPSVCEKPDSTVFNVKRVAFEPLGVKFSSYQDHSKWAVSLRSRSNYADESGWVCLGDINRQFSQFHRGGGTLCVHNPLIWKAFSSIVVEVEPCKSTRMFSYS